MSAHQIDNCTAAIIGTTESDTQPWLRVMSMQPGQLHIYGEEAIRNLRAACDAALGETEPEMQPTKLVCPICVEPQFNTPSGVTCCNGHGGMEGVEK